MKLQYDETLSNYAFNFNLRRFIEGVSGESDTEARWVGVCASDCATGRFLVGAWLDDGSAGGLRTALSTLKPVEVVAPPGRRVIETKHSTDVESSNRARASV